MEPSGEAILRVSDVSVALDGRPVLEHVAFALAPGDTLVILGPNGGGKTVLLRTLLGLVPHSGAISWAPGARIGYVPQKLSADRQLPLTALDVLEVKARVCGLPPSAIGGAVRTMELSPQVLETPFGKLSGGQAQRVLIASGLLGDPPVLLLDEPTSALDRDAEAHVLSLLERLQRQRRPTVVLVSHDLEIARRLATVVLGLDRRALCFGPPAQALTTDALRTLYREQIHGHSGADLP